MFGADEWQNFAGVTAGDAFQFALGHALGIAIHAALRATEGNVDRGSLPGHTCRQSFHFIERDVGMKTDSACARTARNVVLHAVTGEDFHLAVVHFGGNGDFQNAFGRAQNLAQAGIEFQKFRGHIELNLGDAKWIQILARSNARHHGAPICLSGGVGFATVAIGSGPFVKSVLSLV